MGLSKPNPPPPEETVWVLSPKGYRVGVLPGTGSIVVATLDYHVGCLVLDAADLARLAAAAKG